MFALPFVGFYVLCMIYLKEIFCFVNRTLSIFLLWLVRPCQWDIIPLHSLVGNVNDLNLSL